MSDMIERVAKAICGPEDPCRLDLARAAIEAMREPTDAMCGAWDVGDTPEAKPCWQAMIDEALR